MQLELEAAVAAVTAEGEPYEARTETIRGVDFTVFANAPRNLRDLYESGLNHAEKDFYVYQDERYTYQDMWNLAARCANALQDRGIEPGDRVGIALRNYPEWIAAFMGITSFGAVAVAVNAWWSGEELVYGIEDSGLKVLFTDVERTERLLPHLDQLAIEVVTVRHAQPGLTTWEQFTESADTAMPELDIAPEDNATILYTSGSTAHPKGVLSTHRAITNALLGWECGGAIAMKMNPALAAAVGRSAPQPEHPPAVILTVPLFHVTGLVVQALSSFRRGRKLVGMYKWDAEEALHIIEAERITEFNGVPTMAWELVQSPNRGKYDLSSLKSAGGGGAPMAPEHARQIDKTIAKGRARNRLGHDRDSRVGHHDRRRGVPEASAELRPRGAAHRAREGGGRRWTRLCADGNRRTVDLGRDELLGVLEQAGRHVGGLDRRLGAHRGRRPRRRGRLRLHYRPAEGHGAARRENIGCQEVEAVLYGHPNVLEAAVFGVPDERLGETLAAVVVAKPDTTLSAKDVQDFAAEHVAKFKVPDHVWIRTERLPRIASEKIFKRGLRDEAVEALSPGSARG